MIKAAEMSGVFISYRRQDSAASAGRLFDHLSRDLGGHRVFMDVEDIAPGVDFHDVLTAQLSDCAVLLAIIGPNWTHLADAAGRRRLEREDDYVRIEIATALKRNIRVVPVLVDNAAMPGADDLPEDIKPLVRRNAVEITHARFSSDLARFTAALQDTLTEAERSGRVSPDHSALAPRPISGFLSEVIPTALGNYVFLTPELPARQLQTARLRCECPDGEEVLLLMDMTVFRNANNALIFTDAGMRYYNDSSMLGKGVEPLFWRYDRFAGAVLRKETWPNISLDGTLINGGGGADRDDFMNFLLAVQKAVLSAKGDPDSVRAIFQA